MQWFHPADKLFAKEIDHEKLPSTVGDGGDFCQFGHAAAR
jgi:hypothetical protein